MAGPPLTSENACKWCGSAVEPSGVGRPLEYCSGKCRTAAHRARRRASPAGLAALLTAEAERVEVLAGQARHSGSNDALYVHELLRRMATKLRDTAGMLNPDELPF